MYLRRKIDSFLGEWKSNPNHMPLVVKGARQIGKTESIVKFCSENYAHTIYINFVEEPKYQSITDSGYDVDSIVRNITLLDPGKQLIPGHTVLVFDEIQEFPDIATSLKFFQRDGRYDVICSGSMLGVNYKRIESNAVGAKQDYQMHSMDFEEFLWAKGYGDRFVEDILTHMKTLTPFTNTELSVLDTAFTEFCILGGMPNVVKNFIEQDNFSGSLETQQQIALDYEEDVRKYATGLDQGRIMNVYHHIPAQLAKENKKFQVSKVEKGARFKDYRGCVEWLSDSGIVIPCYRMEFPELPLKSTYNDSMFKLYYADTGLLISQLDEEAQEDLRGNKNFGVYKGAIYENLVADAFVKQGIPLRYYKKEDSTLEIDFFLRTANYLVPVEVKARNNKAKSLTALIKGERYEDISFGIKLVRGNIGFSDNIYTFPNFCTFLLKQYIGSGALEEHFEKQKES